MGPPKKSTDDLASLPDLDDTILLEELHHRYRRDFIYTYIGDILVSINPYKTLQGLYGEELGHRYGKAKTLSELLPHVYALGSRAYHNVQRQQGNQCVLVSGESGAGKTEITKMLVAQIARLSQWSGDYFLQERIIEVNPLLEAFGNACTVMNNNSSRFGKLIELIFSEDGSLLGATITEHMLEKSRVVRQGQGEKNFHIFYNLMCGFTPEERQRYFLDKPEKYRIIDPGHGAPVIASEIDYDGYREGMDNMRRIMPIVGFTSQDMDVVFALLGAILHLCNIEMAVEPESEQVMVMNEEEIDFAATLLSVQAEDLITVLMANINWVRGERIVYIKSLNQAVDGRDAMAKALYSRLFSWIVQQINFMLHEDEQREGERYVIGILDMAGFEHFQVNSFEQLCINSANERLQHYFNEHIFSLELREYQAEGIKQPKIKFSNNDELLNLLFQKPMGLFSLLEEECLLARTTDMSFIDKLNKQMSKPDLYKKSKHRDPVFGIVHYAGLVTYTAVGFLDKNRENLSTNMQSLMENSKNNLVNELFSAKVLNTGTLDLRNGSGKNKWQRPAFNQPQKRQYAPGDSLSRQAGRKIRQKMKEQKSFQDIPFTPNPNSASAHFKNSLQLLVDRLKTCEPQFIRCIKPNHQKLPNSFDTRLVSEQLKSTGVLETTKIRKSGYAVRLPFDVFMKRYQYIAYPMTASLEPSSRYCNVIIKCAKLSDVQIGLSKVFLKYWQSDHLNAIMDDIIGRVVRAQANIRACLDRRRFLYHLRMSKQDADEVQVLSNYIDHHGDQFFQTMMTQDHHDVSRATRDRLGREVLQSPMNGYYGNQGDSRLPDVFSPSPIIQGGTVGFYKHILQQVLDRYHDLDPDVWCKMFYMEYDRPVAKFYICDKEVYIDGSYEEFDGKRIGLGAFKNPQRDEVTDKIRTYIGKGIRIIKEADGSLSATRYGKNDIIVKGYQYPASHCLSADVIVNQGRLPFDQNVKIFDMEELKSHIGISMRGEAYDRERLLMLSICGLSFIEDKEDDPSTPMLAWYIN
ncbi:myosin-IIIb-like [Ruditapes philippinarum]|uniref:myosin-IIIb-like n=1 Tax=Ruditapes philippinarum TaxID=129788 RepID=UPI00295B1AB3|nr:myosin-IIIb-like [Ruditapes philippinarum]